MDRSLAPQIISNMITAGTAGNLDVKNGNCSCQNNGLCCNELCGCSNNCESIKHFDNKENESPDSKLINTDVDGSSCNLKNL